MKNSETPQLSMEVLRGRFRKKGEKDLVAELVVHRVGKEFFGVAGEKLHAQRIQSESGKCIIEIVAGDEHFRVFVPNAGECERIGMPVASRYTITAAKGVRAADTIGEALRQAMILMSDTPIYNATIARPDIHRSVKFSVINPGEQGRISSAEAQDLLRLAGVDPRENDGDGFRWPYYPSVDEVAAALDRWSLHDDQSSD